MNETPVQRSIAAAISVAEPRRSWRWRS